MLSMANPRLSAEPLRCVVSNGGKLIQGLATGNTEYYDLESDPGKSENRAASGPADTAALGRVVEGWAETFPDLITDFGDSALDEETRGRAVEQLKAPGYL